MNRPRRFLTIGVLLAGGVGSACHKPVPPVLPAAPAFDQAAAAARLEAGINDGCYLCVVDVLHEFQQLPAQGRNAPPLQQAAARAALLFMLRAKELGIPP